MLEKVSRFVDIWKKRDVRLAVIEAVSYMRGYVFQFYSMFLPQEEIFKDDWEVLIILDSCRPDTLEEVSPDHEWLSEINTKYSVGPDSPTWMGKTFTAASESELSETAYVTANPYSENHAPKRCLGKLEEVWRYAWDDDLGTVPPRPVTDAAIETMKEDYSWVIVHYMQPHFPSIPTNLGYKIDRNESSDEKWVWDGIPGDRYTKNEIYTAYKDNLCYVLDEVDILLNNINSDRVVITADHANAFGEYGIWGHPRNQPAPVVLRVPWVVTKASDTGEHQTDDHGEARPSDNLTDKLKALGYK